MMIALVLLLLGILILGAITEDHNAPYAALGIIIGLLLMHSL